MTCTVSDSFFLWLAPSLTAFFFDLHRLWRLFSLTCTVSDVFSQKSGKISVFFNAHWQIWPKNCSKTQKFRKFEQNLGQICQCANENSKNWTFFSLPFRNANENLGFTKKKQKLIRLGFFQEFLNRKWSKFRKLDLIWPSFLPR